MWGGADCKEIHVIRRGRRQETRRAPCKIAIDVLDPLCKVEE
jgi:hypothetical protein